MPNPHVIYVCENVPVNRAQDEPPKPVESSHSQPQKVAKFNVVATLWNFGGAFTKVGLIPNALRGSRTYKPNLTNSGMEGRKAAQSSAAIIRQIPSSWSDRQTS